MAEKNKTDARKLKAQKRRELAWELKIQGFSFREIAEGVRKMLPEGFVPPSYDARGAWRDVKQELDDSKERTQGLIAGRKEVNIARLEKIMVILYSRAQGGDIAAASEYRKYVDSFEKVVNSGEPVNVKLQGDFSLEHWLEVAKKNAEEFDDALIQLHAEPATSDHNYDSDDPENPS